MDLELSNSGPISLDQVLKFEDALRTLPQVELPTHSLIHGSMYARTIFIPAGTALTGVLTNLDNICIIHGDISVTTDDDVVRFTGYHVIPASKNKKRIGMAHADTYWTTLIHTLNQTVEAAEDEMSNESHLLLTRQNQITQIETES
jgi:hypothetical protein